MPTSLRNLLDHLYSELINNKHPMVNWIQPGITRNFITQKLNNSVIQLPDEVFDLYGWKNGTKIDYIESRNPGELSLFPLGIFAPFDLSLDEYLSYTLGGYWNKNLFPLFGSGGGDYHLIDSEKSSHTNSMIYFYSPTNVDFEGTITKFDSLEALIMTLIECYKSKVYSPINESFLEVDFEKEIIISKMYNPKSNYWKIFE